MKGKVSSVGENTRGPPPVCRLESGLVLSALDE